MRKKRCKAFLLSAFTLVLLLSVTACAGKAPKTIDTYASAKSDLMHRRRSWKRRHSSLCAWKKRNRKKTLPCL